MATLGGSPNRSLTARQPAANGVCRAVDRVSRCYKLHMLEFRILGPLEVWDGEKILDLGGQRQRAVLALLAIHVGEVVPSERLITYLWGESPPPTAATSLQNAVSQLRKALGADVVETRAPGYALNAEKNAVDARRFEQLVNEARSAEADRRAGLVGEALQLWRGPPLADFPYEPFAQNEAARLEELRLTAIEERMEAELDARRRRRASSASSSSSCARTRCASVRAASSCSRSTAAGGRRRRSRPTRTRARCSSRSSASSRRPPCSSCTRRSCARSPRCSRRPFPGRGRTGSGRSRARCSRAGSSTFSARVPPRRTEQSLAGRLAEAFDCPEEHRGDLTRVSQYVAVTQGVGPLYDQLHDLFAEGDEPGPVERFLARPARATPVRTWRPSTSCSSRPPTAVRSSARSRSAAKKWTSSPSSRSARTGASSCIERRTGRRPSSPSRTRTRSSRWPSGP